MSKNHQPTQSLQVLDAKRPARQFNLLTES